MKSAGKPNNIYHNSPVFNGNNNQVHYNQEQPARRESKNKKVTAAIIAVVLPIILDNEPPPYNNQPSLTQPNANYATALQEHTSRIDNDNQNFNSLSIGLNEDYVNSLFGIPIMTFPEYSMVLNDDYFYVNLDFPLRNNFYILEDSVLRVVFDNRNAVVAYFITITEMGRVIPLSVPFKADRIYLGECTFYSISLIVVAFY